MKTKTYLVESKISSRFGEETHLLIQTGTIKEIIEKFRDEVKLRFFELKEIVFKC